MLTWAIHRLRAALLWSRREREMQDEMESHLERAAERLIARGMTGEEARFAARREFGNVPDIQERARDARGGRWIDTLAADVKFGVRHLARAPYTTTAMVGLLALGIGVTAAMFTFLYSMTQVPPAAVTHDESLVRIRGIDPSVPAGVSPRREISYPEYRAYAAQTNVFSDVAAWSGTEVLLDVGTQQPNLQPGAATYVTDNYFRVLGVPLALGVMPAAPATEPSVPHLVAVISHPLWDRHFDRAPDVIGRTVKLDDHEITIVGVAPPRFSGTAMGGSQIRIWLPLSARTVLHRGSPLAFTSPDSSFLGLAARLRPGVTTGQAQDAVRGVAMRATSSATPRRAALWSADVAPLLATNHAPPAVGSDGGGMGRYFLFAMLAIVLLIPCTNVSALLVGLATARRREIVVRMALGADRQRIVRQLLTESVLLALAAATLGVWIIWILLRVFGSRIPDLDVGLHAPVLAFTFGTALIVGTVFGLSPSLHATRVGASDVLKDAAGSIVTTRSRLQATMVVAQIAFAQPLLLVLGTLIMELRADAARHPSTTLNSQLIELRFRGAAPDQPAARELDLRQMAERMMLLPGVVGAIPQDESATEADVVVHPSDRVGDRGQSRTRLRVESAPPGFLELLGVSLLRGRHFTRADASDPHSVILGRELATRLWGSADPIGRRLVGVDRDQGRGTLVVIGVIDDRQAAIGTDERRVFVPTLTMTTHLVVRTEGPATPMMPVLRSFAAQEAPRFAVTSVRTFAAIEASQRANVDRVVLGATIAGVVALLIGAIGLYAVVSFAVGQRTREIGVRAALGADRNRLVSLFLMRGLRLSIVGMVIGLGLSIAALRISTAVRGEELPAGTLMLGAVIASLVVGVALLASYLPARRAAAIDPLRALRTD